MTLADAQQRMQQQWHDLVMAEQGGEPLEVLERMYDRYILLAEEYNACMEKTQRRRQQGRQVAPVQRANSLTGPVLPRQSKKQGTKLAS